MAEVTSDPPSVTLDAQDPLPESNWFFRRWFVFVCTAAQGIAVAVILTMLYQIGQMAFDAKGMNELLAIAGMLHNLALWIISLTIIDRILYMIAPSAEQAALIIQTVKGALGGVSFRKTQTATSTPGGTTGTTTATIEAPNVQPSSDSTPAASPGAAGSRVDSIPDRPPSQR
jgi:hypothetical protein